MPEVIGVVVFLEFVAFLEFLVLLAMFVISDFYGTGTGHASKDTLETAMKKVAGAFAIAASSTACSL